MEIEPSPPHGEYINDELDLSQSAEQYRAVEGLSDLRVLWRRQLGADRNSVGSFLVCQLCLSVPFISARDGA